MSSLNIIDQIQELISNNAIEWKEIKDICKIKRGERITKKQLTNNGKYKVISGGKEIFGRYNKYNRDENTISICQYGTAGFIDFQKEKYWANDVSYSIFPINIQYLSNKFLYYSLINKQKEIYGLTTKAIPDCLPKEKLQEIKIPIPPLEIQNKIVEILDNFSKYEAELEAELEARLKQYKYYLNKLLDFSNDNNVEWKYLWEVTIWNKRFQNVEKSKQKEIMNCFSLSSNDLNKIELDVNGDIRLLSTKKNDHRYTNAKYCKNFNDDEVISIPEGGDANIKYNRGKFINSLNLLCKSIDKKKFNLKYVYYYLLNNKHLIVNQYKGSAIKHPQMNKILEIKIPIPPLEVQNKIVEILDNFSSLLNDIKDGLPKEIELRKKQYQYYLNKLLDFKEIK